MGTTEIFSELSQVPSIDDEAPIIPYQPAKSIAWSKLTVDKIVRIATLKGQPAWSDGFMLEVGEVPFRLKNLKGYVELRRDDPINADNILPQFSADSPVVEPLCTIVGDKKFVPDIVYLSDARRGTGNNVICIKKRYIDYFVKQYGDPWRKFIMNTDHDPLVVTYRPRDLKEEIVGLIMPYRIDPPFLAKCRKMLQPESTYEPPPVAPPPGRISISQLEVQYSLKQLQDMARSAGLSTIGDKKRLIRELLRAGRLQ